MLKIISILIGAVVAWSPASYAGVLLSPVEDAYIHHAIQAPFLADINWDDPNRSGYRYLRVGGNDNYTLASLLRFDLSAYQPESINSNGALRLFGSSGSDSGTEIRYIFNLLAIPWTETSVTWNSLASSPNGSIDSGLLSSLSWSQTVSTKWGNGSIFDFSIPMDILRTWSSNPSANYGLLIQTDTPLSESNWYSKEVLLLAPGESIVSNWAPTLSFEVSEVPEPSVFLLMVSGLAAISLCFKKTKNHQVVPTTIGS